MTLLNEDDTGLTSVGFQIRCGYSVSYERDSERSPSTESADRFIGIEILTPVLDVQQNTNATIVVRPTVEIGCGISCNLKVNLIKPQENDACLPDPFVSKCNITLDGKNSTRNYSMVVKTNFPAAYGEKFAVQILRFKTPNFFFAHRLWENYEFGDVRVRITTNTAAIKGKKCYAVPDPHMSTFNGIQYEHPYTGIYTMYQNTEWKQELQIQTEPCWPGAPVTCVCGVAVCIGKEVYVMEHCSADYWKIGYTQCDKTAGVSLLEVKSVGSSKFKIRLPSSTTISIARYGGQMMVHVFPSVADEGYAEGLCGNLNDNVFRTRNRATVPYDRWGMPTFSNSWSVEHAGINNLFSNDVTDLDPVNTGLFICDCENNVCINNKRCGPLDVERFTSTSTCTVNHFLKKRSTVNNRRRRWSLVPETSVISGSHTIIKRQAETTWINGWTESSATDYCNSVFLNSSIVQICKDIPNVNVQGALDNCILDIELAGDTSFSPVAVETITASCFHEVSYDTRYQQSTTDQPSIFDQIKLVACPLECSRHGTCNQGICTCDDGFGSLDCSISLNTPPFLDHVTNDGYCDSLNSNCSEISAFGGDFVDTDSIRCKTRTYQLTEQGSPIFKEQRIASPVFESVGEVICPLLKPDSTSSIKPEVEYGIVYGVSVSNSGDIFSNESLVVVYNSRCQQCNIVGTQIQCSYKGDFCMSEGECYENDERHPAYTCYSCSINGDSRSWKYNQGADCPDVSTTESTSLGSTTESTGLGSTTESTSVGSTTESTGLGSTTESTGFGSTTESTGLGDNLWIIVGVSAAVAMLSVVAIIGYIEYKKRHPPK
ncbi:von Willebrand factor D and EGF domain-containing protein [Patella vulgata]|uniref:von Willebrand factor D and EGF domain-containing protein n=1 Tax=Patella vulgata TaxID=6465 RepID=UPI0024A7C02C|nr:von Willebrand factor D and EGF domain-containing protein [Patella vulgata]